MALQTVWTTIGNEGVQASVNAGDVIRYGVGNTWVEMTVPTSGTFALGYSYFGNVDPAPNQPKSIQMKSVVVVAETTLTDKTKSFAVGVMAAINAIITKVNSLTGRVTAVETLAASKAAINDTALSSTTTTLSASKIAALNQDVFGNAVAFALNAANEAKAAAISQLSGVDGTQLQALSDLQAALQANSNADGVIASDLLNKVDYSKSQTLTDAQAAQARSNIKFDTAVNAALLATVGDITTFDTDAILATALTLN